MTLMALTNHDKVGLLTADS